MTPGPPQEEEKDSNFATKVRPITAGVNKNLERQQSAINTKARPKTTAFTNKRPIQKSLSYKRENSARKLTEAEYISSSGKIFNRRGSTKTSKAPSLPPEPTLEKERNNFVLDRWVKEQAHLVNGEDSQKDVTGLAVLQNGFHESEKCEIQQEEPETDGRVEPWSLTELRQDDVTRGEHHQKRDGATEDGSTTDTYTDLGRENTLTPAERLVAIEEDEQKVSKYTNLEEWLNGDITDSDEYDTDLEDDFPPEPEEPPDASGANVYQKICSKHGIVPVSFLVRNLGESNLRMRHHYLGGDGTKPLAAAFRKNTVTEEIDLADNYMEGQGAAAIANMLKDNMFIITMNISNNFIGSEGAEAFAEMLEVNTTLKTLVLQGNQLTDADAKRFSEALKNNLSLGCLDLSHNQFGEQGGVYLGAGIAANVGLNDLDLSWNAIRQKGAVAIAKALQTNDMIEILDLSWNGLGLAGATALAKTLRVNKKLKVLDISHNRLNTEAARKFAQGLAKNTGLETLLMGMNPIGDAGVEAVIKAAGKHPHLRLLGLEGCVDITMSPSLSIKIQELESSKDVMVMYSSGSPQQAKVQQSVLLLFDRFISDNSARLEDLFNQLDKDGSGDVTLEELKYGLKDQGLRLTSKQLDSLLDMIDTDKSGTIEYSELTNGLAVASKEKAKRETAIRDALIYAQANNSSRVSSAVQPPEAKPKR